MSLGALYRQINRELYDTLPKPTSGPVSIDWESAMSFSSVNSKGWKEVSFQFSDVSPALDFIGEERRLRPTKYTALSSLGANAMGCP